jgi:CheY-like chemotaxis protein
MHTIFGFMELAHDTEIDPALRESAAVSRASADQLLRSIDDIRELVADAPPALAAIEDMDLTLLTGEVSEVLNLASGRRRRRITLNCPAGSLPIMQDRKAVEQVLTRILSTALKLAGGTDVYVNLEGRATNGIRLSINTRDNDLSGRLVKWLNSTLDAVSLQGPHDLPFGVAVMVAGKRLSALGGSAEATRDAAGHGLVAIDIPCRAPTADRAAGASPSAEMPSDVLSVLVAEDCDDSFFLTELMLEDEHVQRAHDGSEALRMTQKQRFDVVLMDVHMPGMDGYSAIRNIRDWETQTGNARTPLVVLSSDDLETQHRSAAESGCSGFLRKPLRRSDMQSLMERLKQSRRLIA